VQVTYIREAPLEGVDPGLTSVTLGTIEAPKTIALGPSRGADLGLGSAELFTYTVVEGSNEFEAGLRRGDEVRAIDGHRLMSWRMLRQSVLDEPEKEHTLTVRRDGKTRDVTLTFEQRSQKSEFNTTQKQVIFGMVNRSAYGVPGTEASQSRFYYALYTSWTRTKEVFVLTAASLVGLFTGKVGMDQMGGPIFIYEVASKTQEHGWSYFFRIMVWLSISLGLINLLPIPVLDGGNLVLLTIEGIKRSPVSLRTRQIATYIGLAMIIMLMVLVFKNDISRNWDSFVTVFQ
jgi:regulator of sigma E protease